LISAGLIQLQPQRFDGALSACAPLAGSVGAWNQLLDMAFAFNTLLMPDHNLHLVHQTRDSGGASLDAAERVLASPLGEQTMARSALVAAVADVPGWFDPFSSRPTTFAAQATEQARWIRQFLLPFAFAYRTELESRLGGNPSWNTEVDYTQLLTHSMDADEVRGLYQKAGLNLEQDLAALAAASRIAADPSAVDNLSRGIILNGRLEVPVVTLPTIGDGLVPVAHEDAYAAITASAGKTQLLRQLYVNRAGHCAFTPAELITALQSLLQRIQSGRWNQAAISVEGLNRAAAGLGSRYNQLGLEATQVNPAFTEFTPSSFLRVYDSRARTNP
jgi:hypothetical protein